MLVKLIKHRLADLQLIFVSLLLLFEFVYVLHDTLYQAPAINKPEISSYTAFEHTALKIHCYFIIFYNIYLRGCVYYEHTFTCRYSD